MRYYEHFDDAELTERFNRGEDEAFAEIYSRHWFILYKVALKYTASHEESEEMVQTLFEKLWKKRGSLAVNNLGPFLAISLRNLFLDNVRSSAHANRLKADYGKSLIDHFENNQLEFKELINDIESTLQKLPSKTQTVFRLSRFEGKSVKEIAAFIGLTEKAVEYHITKAIKELRQTLRIVLFFF